MTAFLNAVRRGFSSKAILDHIKRRWPDYAYAINTAQGVGYTANHILKQLAGDKENDADQYLTEHEKIQKNDRDQKRRAALGLIGAVGTAGAVAAGAYSLAQRNRPIQPQVLPALPGQRGPQRALSGPQARLGLPAPRPGTPQGPSPSPQTQPPGIPGLYRPIGGAQPRPPAPTQTALAKAAGGPPILPAQQAPEDLLSAIPEHAALERKHATTNQLYDLAIKGKTSGNPFLKVATKLVKTGELADPSRFAQFYHWWNSTEGQPRSHPMVEFEKFRVQTKGMLEPPEEVAQHEEMEAQPPIPQEAAPLPQEEPIVQAPTQMPINIPEHVRQTAFADKPELKRLIDASMKGKEFSTAIYRFPGEDPKQWEMRKTIESATKKAANEIMQGKTFLDLPIAKEVLGMPGSYSTAQDILKFMAGVPNIYSEVLTDEESEEMMDALDMLEGYKPSPTGERDVYGAQLTPNMVWNMLVSVEPKLVTMERPKAMKKTGALKSGEMGSSEFRRSLTHKVYGILSGKNISPELSDKIERISRASSFVDNIAKAAENGNFNQVQREMDRLLNDDAYFYDLFTEEVEAMAAALKGKGIGPKPSAADIRESTKIKEKIEAQQKNKITPEQAKKYYEENYIPEGWYVHGRNGRQDLDTGTVIQASLDWNVARQYAGRNGSKWMIKPNKKTKVLNFMNPESKDMDKLVRKAKQQFNSGALDFTFAENKEDLEKKLRNAFAPPDIVEGAGAYDDQDHLEWLMNNFDVDFVETPDGAVVINIDNVDKVKVAE